MTLTFDLLTPESKQFIFVPKCKLYIWSNSHKQCLRYASQSGYLTIFGLTVKYTQQTLPFMQARMDDN